MAKNDFDITMQVCYTFYMEKILQKEIFNKLSTLIENPKSELNYSNEFELLVAVMLSAQCTDRRVNEVTKVLFEKYKTPNDFALSSNEELEKYIKSCNYYKTKADNIIKTSRRIVSDFGGNVPRTHDELVSLPGVGNKTANVVQAVAFNQQVLPVDTHILRVGNRLGLVKTESPFECEVALKKFFDGYDMIDLHHLFLLFGRYHCTARNPKCLDCVLADICKKC